MICLQVRSTVFAYHGELFNRPLILINSVISFNFYCSEQNMLITTYNQSRIMVIYSHLRNAVSAYPGELFTSQFVNINWWIVLVNKSQFDNLCLHFSNI